MDDVLKYLTISELPESHWKHNEWNILGEVNTQHGHLLVKCWWLSVVVADQKSLVHIKDNICEESIEVEERHSSSIHEGDTNLEENGGIPVMDKVDWTGPGIDVSLNGR